MPLFCGEAVVSYRAANVAELERKAGPTFLLRFVSLRVAFRCFVSLRVASCCFVLFAPLCFTLLPGSGLGSFWVFDLFYFILRRFASFRVASFCLTLFRVASLWSGPFCSASFRTARFCLAFALFCFVSLCFASFCLALLGFFSFASLCFLRPVWERSGIVLGASGALS